MQQVRLLALLVIMSKLHIQGRLQLPAGSLIVFTMGAALNLLEQEQIRWVL
mgnify:FL=1